MLLLEKNILNIIEVNLLPWSICIQPNFRLDWYFIR